MFPFGRRLVLAAIATLPGAASAQVRAAVVHGDSGSVAVWYQSDTPWVYVVRPRGTAVVRATPATVDSVVRVMGVSPDSAKALHDPPALSATLADTYFDYQVERQAQEIPDSPRPHYPDPLRTDHVEGRLIAQFIIDSSGRPVVGSFKALKSANTLFTLAIFSALPDLRFEPPQVKGHPVSELVQIPFAFGPQNKPVIVGAPEGQATVSFDHDTARLVITTAKGTFAIHTDSFTMAAWADSAARLRPPVPHGENKSDYSDIRLSYPEPSLNATVAMGFVRLTADSASPYQLTGSNGSWAGSIVLPFNSAQRLFTAMHGLPPTMNVWPEGPLFARSKPFLAFNLEQQARPKPRTAAPAYPERLRLARTEGSVVCRFYVDTTGVIDLSTVQVLKSSHPLFALSVYRALPAMRFQPAMINGRPVRELVQQPYDFSLTR